MEVGEDEGWVGGIGVGVGWGGWDAVRVLAAEFGFGAGVFFFQAVHEHAGEAKGLILLGFGELGLGGEGA